MENLTRNLSHHQEVHDSKFMYSFEKEFSLMETANWMKNYWMLSFVLVFFYVIMIQVGRAYMKNRPRYRLKWPLFVWNVALTIFYVTGMVRSAPHVFNYFFRAGFHDFVCGDCPFECHKVSLYWGWLFVLMKAPELLDTAFVILRKQPLFFLHWYHHCTVLVFTWYLYGHVSSAGAVYGSINAVVHALMYFYYSLKSLSIRVPRPISMALTVIQISQMAFGCYTNYYVLQVKKLDMNCPVTVTDIWASFVIYVSYFILFMWYFYQAYIAKDALIIAKFKGQKIE